MKLNNDAIASYRIRSGYFLASDAMLETAQEAFGDGSDEVALYLREEARKLRQKGVQESEEWEQTHKK